jgi:hypothetical protein
MAVRSDDHARFDAAFVGGCGDFAVVHAVLQEFR